MKGYTGHQIMWNISSQPTMAIAFFQRSPLAYLKILAQDLRLWPIHLHYTFT